MLVNERKSKILIFVEDKARSDCYDFIISSVLSLIEDEEIDLVTDLLIDDAIEANNYKIYIRSFADDLVINDCKYDKIIIDSQFFQKLLTSKSDCLITIKNCLCTDGHFDVRRYPSMIGGITND